MPAVHARPAARRRGSCPRVHMASGSAPPFRDWTLAEWKASGIELVVFDCAGTVIDEGAIVYASLKKVLQDEGLTVSDDEFNKWHGANKLEVIQHFYYAQRPGPGDKRKREADGAGEAGPGAKKCKSGEPVKGSADPNEYAARAGRNRTPP